MAAYGVGEVVEIADGADVLPPEPFEVPDLGEVGAPDVAVHFGVAQLLEKGLLVLMEAAANATAGTERGSYSRGMKVHVPVPDVGNQIPRDLVADLRHDETVRVFLQECQEL